MPKFEIKRDTTNGVDYINMSGENMFGDSALGNPVVRPCYVELYDFLMSEAKEWEDGVDETQKTLRAIITGNINIGKTYCGIYFLLRLVQERKEKDEKIMYLFDDAFADKGYGLIYHKGKLINDTISSLNVYNVLCFGIPETIDSEPAWQKKQSLEESSLNNQKINFKDVDFVVMQCKLKLKFNDISSIIHAPI